MRRNACYRQKSDGPMALLVYAIGRTNPFVRHDGAVGHRWGELPAASMRGVCPCFRSSGALVACRWAVRRGDGRSRLHSLPAFGGTPAAPRLWKSAQAARVLLLLGDFGDLRCRGRPSDRNQWRPLPDLSPPAMLISDTGDRFTAEIVQEAWCSALNPTRQRRHAFSLKYRR